MQNLLFDKATESYTLNGKRIPRVSDIVRAVTGKDMSSIPPEVLAKAAARGTAIHEDISSESFKTPEGQWVKSQLGDTDFFSEIKGSAKLGDIEYAGTCDLLSDAEIDDVKSQGEADLLYWTLQLNLYRRMFPGRDLLAVLWTPKSGNYKRVPIETLSEERMLEIADAYKSGRILPANWPTEAKPETPSLDLVATLNVGQLTTNARSILAFVKAQCAGYKAENYSESNIAEAKRDKAELNTAAKKFNDRRLELERDFMKPFDDFKDTIGEICAEIKKASGLIDGVVKEVEEREKADKRKLLEEAWTALDCQLFDLSKIWNPSWLNKTTKNKDVVVEMTAKIEKVKADLVVLDRIGEPDAKAHYLSTLNLESALAEADCIKANRERLAAAEKARLEREASPRTPTPISTPASIPAPAARVAATQPSVETTSSAVAIAEPEILERTMRVRGTREQIIALGNWMNENNIDFEKL